MERLKLHWEAAAPGVRAAYEDFSKALAGGDFYLAGGTALALLEGHRISADLDFFAPKLGDPDALARRIATRGMDIQVISTASETLYVQAGMVEASFIGSPFPLLAPPAEPAHGLLPLASPEDIAAMKLAAAASRGCRKDFVDLWVLITCGKSLKEHLEGFQKKYEARDIGHVVRSLVFFDDADREPPLRLLAPIDWERVKEDFKKWVAQLLE
jgi:hypothetical protein